MRRIRELRAESGLTQVRLAVAADMNPATLNRIEQGKANPNIKTLERLAEALGVGLTELLENDSPKAQASLWPEEPQPALSLGTLNRHLHLGETLADLQESELENRTAIEDEDWMRGVVAVWEDFTAVLKAVTDSVVFPEYPETTIGRMVDLNARITKVQEHINHARDRGRQKEQVGRGR